jgi:hypothetical protein
MYIGDGDVYFYWSAPQNYHSHGPVNLTNEAVYNIHNKDKVHFSDTGAWVDKQSEYYKKTEWVFKLLNYSFNGPSTKVPSTDHTKPTKSMEMALQPNQSLDHHISLANLTAMQMKKYLDHLKGKNLSAKPDWFKKKVVPKEHAGILWYTIFWHEMENGTTVGECLFILYQARLGQAEGRSTKQDCKGNIL